MNKSIIQGILLDNKYISDIIIEGKKIYNTINYEFMINCNLWANNRWIPIRIGVHKNWEISLFDFYLKKYLYIPHVEANGKICLYNLDNTIIDYNFEGLLNQCIEKAKEIIVCGENGNNKKDFLEEFNAYYKILAQNKASLLLSNIQENQIIWYAKKTNQSYTIAENTNFFLQRKNDATIQKGIYFYIEPNNPIYPPCRIFFDSKAFINELISHVNPQIFHSLYNKNKRELLLIVAIKQSADIVNFCGFLLANPIFSNQKTISLQSVRQCDLIMVNRIDPQYLTNRISFGSSNIENKSFVIIGCGSIGGYIFHNLLTLGCTNITIIDDDTFTTENIYRHFLSNESVETGKVFALKKYATDAFPEVNVVSYQNKIENLLDEDESFLSHYDYIISAVASHTVNRWLNNYLKQHKIKIPTFYVWNEPLDIGCHVALISHKNPFCYQNLFGRDELESLYDISSYCEKNQNFVKSLHGCAGSFIPYGSTLSIQSSLLLINLLKQHLEGAISENILLSEKNSDYYFTKFGFKVSERYNNQKNKIELIKLKDLVNGVK